MIANPGSTLYLRSNPIEFPTILTRQNRLKIDRLSVSLFSSASSSGGGGWSGKLTAKSGNRLVIEAKRKGNTGRSGDGANSDELKWTQLGQITESLSNGMFRVSLLNLADKREAVANGGMVVGYLSGKALVPIRNGDPIICYGSGKMRTNRILILPGDVVKVELSNYDLARGRIVYRFHPREWKKRAEEDEEEEEEAAISSIPRGRKGAKNRRS